MVTFVTHRKKKPIFAKNIRYDERVATVSVVFAMQRRNAGRILADLQAEGLVERTKEGGYVRNKRA
jgi:DNA-binding IclR family transcriptional regulator